jgi:predicted nucleic acid-binding Zn ribbon protein
MPRYTYQFIDTEETIEVYQSMSESTLTEIAHPETEELMPVKKVFSAPAISGFTPTPATVAPTHRPDRSSLWNSAQHE